MKTLLLFSALTFAFTAYAGDGRFSYRYEMKASGTAPTLLSVEGWDANLAKDCRTNAEDGTVACAGTFKALSILPHGSIFVRGPVTADQVELKIFQKCRKSIEREVTGIQSEPIRSNELEGLFYIELDALLNPCGLPQP